jgi:hypothetical protein
VNNIRLLPLLYEKLEEVSMNDTNVNTETAKENETKAEKFIRLGEHRVNKVMNALGQLEHLANHSFYEYTEEQAETMFAIMEERLQEVKNKFAPKHTAKTTFSFGKSAE